MTMGKKSLHLYHHFGKKIIFMQTTNTYRGRWGITNPLTLNASTSYVKVRRETISQV